jgi:aryl-alcohol dehydrogenase-like predicted oxidoreductase
MTKIDGRTKKEAAKQIEESLKRLQTDHIDLIQHHEVLRMEDPDRIFAPGGSQEAMLEAKKAGKLRFIGFTGHKDPLVHQRMLEMAAEHSFHFDTVQMPINVMDAHFRSFSRNVIPILVREKIGVLGMKSMGSGAILKSKTVTAVECLQFALTLPTSVVIRGIDSLEVLKQDLEAVKNFKPLTTDQITALLNKTRDAAVQGKFERFKTSTQFDGTAKNPLWMGEPEPNPD